MGPWGRRRLADARCGNRPFFQWDEELKPEVKQALAWQMPEGAFDDNGYLIALGIEAPASENPAALGAQVLRQELSRFEAFQTRHKEPPLEPLSPERVEKHPGLGELACVYAAEVDCVGVYARQDRAQLERLLTAQKRLSDRFEAIWKAKHFIEAAPPLLATASSNLPALRDASELQRMQAVMDIAGGRIDEGMARFATNAAHSRRFLQESNTLIFHMVALSFVHRDVRILSELLRHYPSLARQHAALIDPLLAPISGVAYQLTRGFQHERALRLQVFRPLEHADAESMVGPGAGMLARWFVALNYLHNATLNDAYALWAMTLRLAEADALQLDAIK